MANRCDILDRVMLHSAENLSKNHLFFAAVLRFANEMLTIYSETPRIASIFAAKQRWLMAQSGYALHAGYPGGEKKGLYAGRFIDFAVKHKIASRNTAAAFMQEMLAYKFLAPAPETSDKRLRLLLPTAVAEESFYKWLHSHLAILDYLDGGTRAERTMSNPLAAMAKIQPHVAKGLVENDAIRNPGEIFDLFNWANSGGLVMDYMITRLPDLDLESAQVPIGRLSLKEMRDRFMISSTHLKRLMTQAAAMGSVGWMEPGRKGDFWLSRQFIQEYWDYQAAKFAIIDAAFETAMGPAFVASPKAS
jgi:hypothetical protein